MNLALKIHILKNVLADLLDCKFKDYHMGDIEKFCQNVEAKEVEQARIAVVNVACAGKWGSVILNPETFEPIWRFIQPTAKQITIALWAIT